LLQHTLTGFRNMPPLGYCMACEEDDFIALIEFMGTTHE
jgi:cytochrome c5